MTDNLRSVVMQAIGQASMCWESPERAGVFQSDQAIKVAEKLIEEINSVLKPVTGGSNADGELKIKMDDGKEVTLNSDEAKELLGKLKDIFPEPIYIPSTPTIIQEPYRWWEKVWYSNTGNVTISNKTE